ncbi:MAG: YaaR family protein [bacterium]
MINTNIPLEAMADKSLFQTDSIKEKNAPPKIDGKTFDEELKTATKEKLKLYLDDLLNKIEAQGKILVQSPIYENLTQYRHLVQTFMEKVVKNLYSLEETTTTVRPLQAQLGQRQVNIIIKEINKNLSELTEGVLKTQINPINIAAKVEMIQGLLMDLYS